MYQIRVDDYILHDPRRENLLCLNPKCKLKVNTVGESSFTVLHSHPYYDKLKKLKSIFEIRQDSEVIFRGRMTEDSKDFYNRFSVDLEGVLAFTNDSIIEPFNFPEDFLENEDYITAAESGNVVEFFLRWVLGIHNGQVEEWQQLKPGNVTVSDPNNYLSRSSTSYETTWKTLQSKLFDSALGGFLCIRYEDDGNYVDYVSEFELTNTQRIKFGKNLLDLTHKTDASETYSAMLPIGKDGLTLESLADGDLTDDVVKKGKFIYSKSAVQNYGWKCAPISDSKWDDVTQVENLKTKSVEALIGDAVKMSDTITAKAVDLHLTDDEIQTFRIYRNIIVDSAPHGVSSVIYQLTELDIDMANTQNTKITVGATIRTMTDFNDQQNQDNNDRIESTKNELKEEISNSKQEIDSELREVIVEQSTSVLNTAETIILQALESYVETSNYEEFRQTVESQLQILSDEISLKFTQTIEQIENVNGDLQSKYNTITKYFAFDIDGLTIGQTDSPNKVVIDNDEITILVNGIPVQKFDAEGKALIPELRVTRMLNLFGYLIDQDEDENVNCEYIGGES
jgi:hypothetical protein